MSNIQISGIFILKIFFSLAILFQISTAHAQEKLFEIDIYGTDQINSEQIKKQFYSELSIIAITMKKSYGTSNNLDTMHNAVNKIGNSIMSTGKFANVNISPIIYSNNSIIFITLDVLEKNSARQLLHFLPTPTKNIHDPHHLISTWRKYEKLGFNLVFQKNETISDKKCPAHHCIHGFEHPKLRKYLNVFNRAEKHKDLLVDILRHDKNPHKREAAAYLLAHIKSKQELVKLIMPSVKDAYPGVRNNVLRILIDVAQDNKIPIPLDTIIAAVNYPNTTDRNKALCILVYLANNKKYAKIIKATLATQLINNLKLQQPINHDPAYEILKKISGKNYGERDYNAWENWLKQ